jgi:hypothetical protein
MTITSLEYRIKGCCSCYLVVAPGMHLSQSGASHYGCILKQNTEIKIAVSVWHVKPEFKQKISRMLALLTKSIFLEHHKNKNKIIM